MARPTSLRMPLNASFSIKILLCFLLAKSNVFTGAIQAKPFESKVRWNRNSPMRHLNRLQQTAHQFKRRQKRLERLRRRLEKQTKQLTPLQNLCSNANRPWGDHKQTIDPCRTIQHAPNSWPVKTTDEQPSSLNTSALHSKNPEVLDRQRLSPHFRGGIYSSWYTDQYYKEIWRSDVSQFWGLTPRKSLERMFNEAAKSKTPFITFPLTTQKLDLSTVKNQGSQITFRFNQSEYIADCKLGMINGRSVRTSAMADVMHAACTFAFGV